MRRSQDRLYLGVRLQERTIDWYGQDAAGNVQRTAGASSDPGGRRFLHQEAYCGWRTAMFAAFQSILVALDGEQGGLDAAALGSLLTAPGTQLTLAHVATDARIGGEPLQTAVNVVRRLRPDRPVAGPELVPPLARSVVAGLRELVDTRGVELLVVGAHHHRHLRPASHDHTRDALRHLSRRMAEIPGIDGAAVEGDPYHALLDLSRELDLLVVGAHHRSALHRLLPGDVAEGFAGSARGPLVVVPHNG